MKTIKNLLFLTLVLFPTIAFSQSVKELFLQIPTSIIEVSSENRSKLITETNGDFLKFRLSEARQGELKIIAQKKDEIILGMSVSSCDDSNLYFWTIKKGVWKETNDIIPSLGEKDVVAILKVSPATVSNPNQSLDIGYFYKFAADSTDLQLIARKQDSCDIAGKVYDYKFNGKKFAIVK